MPLGTRPWLLTAAAQLLVDEFRQDYPDAWPTLEDGAEEVDMALEPEKVAFAAVAEGSAAADDGLLLGWIGALPTYDGLVWELHPIVVRSDRHRSGIGRALVLRLEEELRTRGALTIWLGTDDVSNKTTLGGIDLYPGLLEKLARVEDLHGHPIGFYLKLGFEVAGVVPDANGFGRPDILMAKRVPR